MNRQISFERLAPNQPLEADGNGSVFIANPDGTHLHQVPVISNQLQYAHRLVSRRAKLLLAYSVRFDNGQLLPAVPSNCQ